jgi:tetratricopeptide (TPR) repeat protein
MKSFYSSMLFAGFMVFSMVAGAQSITLQTPHQSPKAVSVQTIGLTDVEITYHRPAVNERKIWGELVPYNAVWRAGANDNTVFACSDDISINGQNLPAGEYGFHIIPGKTKSTLIFSKNYTQWGSYSYDESEDALRVEIENQPLDHVQEYLAFEFIPVDIGSATCRLVWEKMSFPFTIETDVHATVLSQIRKDLQTKPGWTWLGWYEAAKYCLRYDVNLEEGLQWASRSVFMTPNANNMKVKAVLTGKVRGKGDAEKEKSMALASFKEDLQQHSCTWKEYAAAANFAVQQEDWDMALSWADKATDMSPNMTAMMAKAAVYEKKGDTKMAAKTKEKAIANGSNAELNMYGYQLMRSGKTEEAVAVFEANADKHPMDPNVWDSLGEGYYNNQQHEKAIKAFRKSLSLNPADNVRANSERFLMQLEEKEDMKP